MFDKIGNLPLHPLVIHAAVIGIPLAVLLAFLFAFPKTREWARWPLAIVVVGATAVTFVARQSGLAFQRESSWTFLYNCSTNTIANTGSDMALSRTTRDTPAALTPYAMGH